REPEPHVHARRVVLNRRVDERLEPGEPDDVVEAGVELLLRHAEDGAVQVDVLTPGELGMEAGAELEQRRDLPRCGDPPTFRPQDAGDALQQRALARSVLADQPERAPLWHLERDALERVELLVARATSAHHGGL